jgi:hypothetical protein
MVKTEVKRLFGRIVLCGAEESSISTFKSSLQKAGIEREDRSIAKIKEKKSQNLIPSTEW